MVLKRKLELSEGYWKFVRGAQSKMPLVLKVLVNSRWVGYKTTTTHFLDIKFNFLHNVNDTNGMFYISRYRDTTRKKKRKKGVCN